MRPAQRETPEGRISLNSGRPIIGLRRKAGFGFLSSTAGLPVLGSVGWRNQTTTPQMPEPQRLT